MLNLKAYLVGIIVSAVLSAHGWTQTATEAKPSSADAGDRERQSKTRLLEAYHTLPLAFEANIGQTNPQVKFLARQGAHMLFLTANGAVVASQPKAGRAGSATPSKGARPVLHTPPPGGIKPAVLRMTWVGANPKAKIDGIDEFPGKINYLVGNHPTLWRTRIPMYAKVRYHDIYPGVDLLYYGHYGQWEYDLVVAPHADTKAIRLSLSGARSIALDPGGDLIVTVGQEHVRLHKPIVYQPVPAGSQPSAPTDREFVAGHYVLKGRHEIQFKIGAHDASRPLIIDPQVTYSSYLGGSATDEGEKVAVDADGNAYIVGFSASTDFPLVDPLQNANAGITNVVVSKVNPTAPGTASLIYSTYLGGSDISIGRGIAVDALGQIYIAGDTNSPDFPVTPGAYQATCTLQRGLCSTDLFAAKLDATGSTLLYATYLGGSGTEYGFALAIDAAGHMFITGNTDSPDFPVTSGALQTTFAGGGTVFGDAFVVELNPAGQGASDLVYATYLGGSGSEQTWGIALDSAGGILVSGSTTSRNFPVTSGAYQKTYAGSGNLGLGDAFIAKLYPTGQGQSDLVYATYLGDASDDLAESIAVDAADLAYVTGFTTSKGFPITPATAYQTTFGSGVCGGGPCADVFITKLDPSASGAASLLYSTFFGGSSFDLGHAIAVNDAGLVYVTGETASIDFPLLHQMQSHCAGGCIPLPMDDVFLARFDLSKAGTAALLFSTYLGGSDVDTGWGLAIDSAGNAYVTGQVFSKDFPTVMPFQAFCNNCSSFSSPSRSGDSFLVKVCFSDCPAVHLSTLRLSFAPQNVGTSSAAQSIVVANLGSGALTIAGITITGPNRGDFSQTNDCPIALASQATCTIQVTFTPTAVGSRAGTLALSDNLPGSPQSVSLAGTGVVPVVSLSTSSVSFGHQTVHTSSTSQSITLTNRGPGTLNMNGTAVTGTHASDYRLSSHCPATLAVNRVCTIRVTFTPTSKGGRTASVKIMDNGSGSPQTVSLRGTGVAPAAALLVNSVRTRRGS